MNTYNIPRNVKGEGRILFVFSTKALIYCFVGVAIGFIFNLLFALFDLKMVGYIMMLVFGLIGFIIGTFKIPESSAFELTKKTGGENIDNVIIRAFKFKMKKNRIYIYTKQKTSIETKEKGGETNE